MIWSGNDIYTSSCYNSVIINETSAGKCISSYVMSFVDYHYVKQDVCLLWKVEQHKLWEFSMEDKLKENRHFLYKIFSFSCLLKTDMIRFQQVDTLDIRLYWIIFILCYLSILFEVLMRILGTSFSDILLTAYLSFGYVTNLNSFVVWILI